ncbi:MAG: hypothetical protein CVV28_02315 [Methanobacteriales archaeon HGW-Methanobacteriales-1]|jgi:ParB-like chromosome segregation protein Spo0J|nr:MAG: hypothetical protein CVV28_02315 [Methanobacteriales archaeon HGW-Methanobacteriales-1]
MDDKSPWIEVSKLKLHPNNPNEHPSEQLDKIAKNIKELGWGRPILISKDFYIIAGHGAFIAATEKLGMDKVPFRQREYLHDSSEAIALMIADNKLSEESYWNYPKLEELSIDLEMQEFDLSLTGFEIDELVSPKVDDIVPDEEPEFDEDIAKSVETIKCPECGYEFPK